MLPCFRELSTTFTGSIGEVFRASGTTNGNAGCVAQVNTVEGPPGQSIEAIKLYLSPVPGALVSTVASLTYSRRLSASTDVFAGYTYWRTERRGEEPRELPRRMRNGKHESLGAPLALGNDFDVRVEKRFRVRGYQPRVFVEAFDPNDG